MSTQPATPPAKPPVPAGNPNPPTSAPVPAPTPVTIEAKEHQEVRERFTAMNQNLRDFANEIKQKTAEIRRANGIDLPAVSKIATDLDKMADALLVNANNAQRGH